LNLFDPSSLPDVFLHPRLSLLLSPHSIAIGFVRGKPPGQSIDTFRNSAHHNGPMGSFGETDSGRSRLFSRPIPPIMPLASFGNTVVGLVRGGELASFGETVRAVWRTSSIGTNCQRAAHARTPTSSSGDAASAFRESVEEDWCRRGRHRRRRQVFEGAECVSFP
jgi:hypothetical protein